MNQRALEVIVGPDGGVAAGDLASLGAFPRDIGFTQEHLDEIRHDMGVGLGDDLTI